MSDRLYRRVAETMDQLMSLARTHPCEDIADAVMAWSDDVANDLDQDTPSWYDLLASEVRAAFEIVADADLCQDTCFIRIVWSDKSRAVTFRFDAAQGAGPRLAAVIQNAVAAATIGDAKGGAT
jgi:hypothetical protein